MIVQSNLSFDYTIMAETPKCVYAEGKGLVKSTTPWSLAEQFKIGKTQVGIGNILKHKEEYLTVYEEANSTI